MQLSPTDSSDRGTERASPAVVRPGDRVAGYEIVRLLRRGRSGDSYLAIHRSGLEVEVRFLPDAAMRDELTSRRIHREVLALMALRHRAITRVWAIGQEAGREYLALEYAAGSTLSTWLEHLGQIEVNDALHVHLEVLDALSEMALRGLLHRDVNPGAIVLADDGRVMLTDFMLAREALDPDDGGDGTLLDSEEMKGAHYKAPEQLVEGRADHRSDLYAVGVSLYESLSGALPFEGPGIAAVVARCELPPIPISDRVPGMPEELSNAVMRFLEPDPDERYQTAADAIATLKVLARGARHAEPM